MKPVVDLHVHSNKSDGSFTPSQLVEYAMEKGLSAFALTDHDTVGGLEEAITFAEEFRRRYEGSGTDVLVPEVIPGIELSTEYEGRDIHIVGLFIDYKNESFTDSLQHFIDSRTDRNHKMCANLRQAGIDITYEALQEMFPDSVITRAHYARYLLEKGYIKSMPEAFDRYVGDRCPFFVPREKVTPFQAIELILAADGIPVLAHPVLYRMSGGRLDNLVGALKAAGLLALECIYSTYSSAEQRDMYRLADKHGLLPSGGSDFHGAAKPGLDMGIGYGGLIVPSHIWKDLMKCRKRALFTDMDGTLLQSGSVLSEEMKAALALLIQKGHHLVLSSGRPLPSILEVAAAQGLTYRGMLIIANNGGLIYDCDSRRPLYESRIAQDDARLLLEQAEKFGIHTHTYSDTHISARCMNEELAFYTNRIHMPVLYAEDILSAVPEGRPYKIQCIHLSDRSRLEAFRDAVAPLVEGRIQMIFSSDRYLELLPCHAGKGNALRFVCSSLHLPLSHAYAAGDAENDISMLSAAGHGIAMQNAGEEVKKAAAIITRRDNNHDGLLEILETYFSTD